MERRKHLLMKFLQIFNNSIQYDNLSLDGYHQYRIIILWLLVFAHVGQSCTGLVKHCIQIGFAYWGLELAFITYDSLPTTKIDDE